MIYAEWQVFLQSYDIIHVNKPAPVKQPDWVASADMIFQDNTWFWRESEERGKRIYLPQNRKDYVLDTNGDDGGGEVFRMGVEIMEELCRERTVLTTFDAYGPLSQKKHSISPRSFPERYHCFLQKVHPNVSTYAKNNQELSILSIGFNRDAYFAYAEIREPGPWFEESVSFYRFSENYIPSSAEEAQILAEKHQAELAMYFHAWPDELHFDFDPQNVDVNEIWSVIEQVCKKHNLIVMRPPSDRINF